jgi:hypothetical protein
MVREQERRAVIRPVETTRLKEMRYAQSIIDDRYRDLSESLKILDVDRFVHELWSLGGDMAHFEFDLDSFAGADDFKKMLNSISTDALKLTSDLAKDANRAVFKSELLSVP